MEKKILIREYEKQTTKQQQTEIKDAGQGIDFHIGDTSNTRFNIRIVDGGIEIHKTRDGIDGGIVYRPSASNTTILS
jgi:hypothetical protein